MGPAEIAAAVAQIRSALNDDFAPRAKRALSRWPVETHDTEIAGVDYQIVDPDATVSSGTMLYIFGGGYVSGCPEFELPITAALASLAGIRVIVPRYALAPEHPFPAALDQCLAVYTALARQTEHQPFALGGESAGGGMALALVREALRLELPPPDRLVLFSPWGDLTPEGIARTSKITDPTITTEDLHVCAHAYLGRADPSDPRISPGRGAVPTNWPATLLTTGTRDILQDSVRALATDLLADGASADLIDAAGMCHVFEIYDEFHEGTESLRKAAEFLRGA